MDTRVITVQVQGAPDELEQFNRESPRLIGKFGVAFRGIKIYESPNPKLLVVEFTLAFRLERNECPDPVDVFLEALIQRKGISSVIVVPTEE